MSSPSMRALTSGKALSASTHGLDEERHEAKADAVLFLEGFLVAAAQVEDGGHVGFVERGQRWRSLFCDCDQPLGDALADRAHAFARALPAARPGPRAAAPWVSPGSTFVTVPVLFFSTSVCTSSLVMRPPGPVPASVAHIHLGLLDEPAHGGRQRHLAPHAVAGRRGACRLACSRRTLRGLRLRLRRRGGRLLRFPFRRRGTAFLDAADHGADATVFPSGTLIFSVPDAGRHDFGRRFFGLQLEERLVLLDGFAVLLQPAASTPSVIDSPTEGTLISTGISVPQRAGHRVVGRFFNRPAVRRAVR